MSPSTFELESAWLHVASINRAWQSKDFDALAELLAHDLIVVAPRTGLRLHGRNACIETYREFVERCEVTHFDVTEYFVDALPPHDARADVDRDRVNTAVVTVTYEMRWRDRQDRSERYDEPGHEQWMVKRRAGRWQAVFRTLFV